MANPPVKENACPHAKGRYSSLLRKENHPGETAEILCISVRTVDHHRANLMDKLETPEKLPTS